MNSFLIFNFRAQGFQNIQIINLLSVKIPLSETFIAFLNYKIKESLIWEDTAQ